VPEFFDSQLWDTFANRTKNSRLEACDNEEWEMRNDLRIKITAGSSGIKIGQNRMKYLSPWDFKI